MGQLRISVGTVQTVNTVFHCRVHITDGQPGDDVIIRLWQTAGVAPRYSGERPTTLNGNGEGLVVFDDVRLAGPCTARLVADDAQSAVPLHADDVHIEVVT